MCEFTAATNHIPCSLTCCINTAQRVTASRRQTVGDGQSQGTNKLNGYGSVVTGYLRLVTRSPERRCSTAKICSKSKAGRRLRGEEL
jgi:hypothetical protein